MNQKPARAADCGFVGGDGFDETGDGEGVADAAFAADQMESAALARERNGKFHERGDAGAVDLGNIVEVDDHFAGAARRRVFARSS